MAPNNALDSSETTLNALLSPVSGTTSATGITDLHLSGAENGTPVKALVYPFSPPATPTPFPPGAPFSPLVTSAPDSTMPVMPVASATTDTLVLDLSEDAWQGNADFAITVDGNQVGSTQAVTALHSQGASQLFTFTGDWGTGVQDVGITFENDAWGGSPAEDRNLYVNSATLNGASTSADISMWSNGTSYVDVTAPSETLELGGSSTSYTSIGQDTILGGAGADAVSLDGPSALFMGEAGTDAIAAGAGTDTIEAFSATMMVQAGSGTMSFIAGSASSTVMGGSGTMTYTGGTGASTVVAASGASTLTGGNGSLMVEQGSGNTVVKAGTGSETYDINAGSVHGFMQISDFKLGVDHISLSGYSPSEEYYALSTARNTAAGLVMRLSDNTVVDITNLHHASGSVFG